VEIILTHYRPRNQLAAGGGRYCSLHVNNNRRLKALYDHRSWRAITRPFILRRDPLCQIAVLCGGRRPSVDVDHIQRAEAYIAAHPGDEIPGGLVSVVNVAGAAQVVPGRRRT